MLSTAERVGQRDHQHLSLALEPLRNLTLFYAADFQAARIQFQRGNRLIRQTVKTSGAA
jgi:hypothetical protein